MSSSSPADTTLCTVICSHGRAIPLLFLCNFLRLFAYSAVAVVFINDLVQLSTAEATACVVCCYLGDFILSNLITSNVDTKISRRLALSSCALLMVVVGVAFHFSRIGAVMIAAATIGIVSPSGAGGLGPFTALEQSSVSNMVERLGEKTHLLTSLIALLNFASGAAQASGSLTCGFVVKSILDADPVSKTNVTSAGNNSSNNSSNNALQNQELRAYETIFLGYAVLGGLLSLLYASLPCDVELTEEELTEKLQLKEKQAAETNRARALLMMQHHDGDDEQQPEQTAEQKQQPATKASPFFQKLGFVREKTAQSTVMFSLLFFLDAIAGGIVQQSFLSFWAKTRYGFQFHSIGLMLAGINMLSAASALLAAPLVRKLGAIRTMVFTHLPSNIMLVVVGVVSTKSAAIGILVARYAISQMDVPARQAYVNLVTPKDEKSAANGMTTSVRSLAVACSGFFLMPVVKAAAAAGDSDSNTLLLSLPFFVAGGAKTIYDLLVWYFFTKATGEVGHEEDEKKPLLQ